MAAVAQSTGLQRFFTPRRAAEIDFNGIVAKAQSFIALGDKERERGDWTAFGDLWMSAASKFREAATFAQDKKLTSDEQYAAVRAVESMLAARADSPLLENAKSQAREVAERHHLHLDIDGKAIGLSKKAREIKAWQINQQAKLVRGKVGIFSDEVAASPDRELLTMWLMDADELSGRGLASPSELMRLACIAENCRANEIAGALRAEGIQLARFIAASLGADVVNQYSRRLVDLRQEDQALYNLANNI